MWVLALVSMVLAAPVETEILLGELERQYEDELSAKVRKLLTEEPSSPGFEKRLDKIEAMKNCGADCAAARLLTDPAGYPDLSVTPDLRAFSEAVHVADFTARVDALKGVSEMDGLWSTSAARTLVYTAPESADLDQWKATNNNLDEEEVERFLDAMSTRFPEEQRVANEWMRDTDSRGMQIDVEFAYSRAAEALSDGELQNGRDALESIASAAESLSSDQPGYTRVQRGLQFFEWLLDGGDAPDGTNLDADCTLCDGETRERVGTEERATPTQLETAVRQARPDALLTFFSTGAEGNVELIIVRRLGIGNLYTAESFERIRMDLGQDPEDQQLKLHLRALDRHAGTIYFGEPDENSKNLDPAPMSDDDVFVGDVLTELVTLVTP